MRLLCFYPHDAKSGLKGDRRSIRFAAQEGHWKALSHFFQLNKANSRREPRFLEVASSRGPSCGFSAKRNSDSRFEEHLSQGVFRLPI